METLNVTCSDHSIFSGYSHIPMPDEALQAATPETRPDLLQKKLVHENLRNFIGTLSGSMNLLLFAQRKFIINEFKEFQQWDLVLEDTNSPWDWDHIYPSAVGLHNVYSKYRAWHNTIGNKRAEALSKNRANGASLPKEVI